MKNYLLTAFAFLITVISIIAVKAKNPAYKKLIKTTHVKIENIQSQISNYKSELDLAAETNDFNSIDELKMQISMLEYDLGKAQRLESYYRKYIN